MLWNARPAQHVDILILPETMGMLCARFYALVLLDAAVQVSRLPSRTRRTCSDHSIPPHPTRHGDDVEPPTVGHALCGGDGIRGRGRRTPIPSYLCLHVRSTSTSTVSTAPLAAEDPESLTFLGTVCIRYLFLYSAVRWISRNILQVWTRSVNN